MEQTWEEVDEVGMARKRNRCREAPFKDVTLRQPFLSLSTAAATHSQQPE